jgi:hypothetical protein
MVLLPAAASAAALLLLLCWCASALLLLLLLQELVLQQFSRAGPPVRVKGQHGRHKVLQLGHLGSSSSGGSRKHGISFTQ